MHLKLMVSALKEEISILKITGNINIDVKGLAYDSRDIEEGFAFFALKGLHTDGHIYIQQALKLGAQVIFYSDELKEYCADTTYIKVADTRIIMAPVSAYFYNFPAHKLILTGVTGTDGKSTTVSLIHQLLTLAGFKTGFISTVQYDTGAGAVKNHYRQSTPEATEIHKLLAEMVKNGCTHAVIETTSHGLSPLNNRLGTIPFTAGVLTNISHEHLEFHKTLKCYVDDKANLFRKIKSETGFGVVNRDEQFADYFIDAADTEVFTYSVKTQNADISAISIKGTEHGESFTILSNSEKFKAEIDLPGIFNVENTLAALLTVSRLINRGLKSFIPLLPLLKPIKGRMNFINCGQDFKVLVDYAHTPGAFEKLFPLLSERKKGKLITVFGSAGERDTEKRSIQGEIADRYADIIILTDEDPRGEDPFQIMNDIAAGCRRKKEGENLFLIPDRRKAIQFAFKTAKKDDLVILLGKGHEGSIIYESSTIPWNESETAVSLLKEITYYKREN